MYFLMQLIISELWAQYTGQMMYILYIKWASLMVFEWGVD